MLTINRPKFHVSFSFSPHNFWIGFYYLAAFRLLYVCPLPMCRFKIQL